MLLILALAATLAFSGAWAVWVGFAHHGLLDSNHAFSIWGNANGLDFNGPYFGLMEDRVPETKSYYDICGVPGYVGDSWSSFQPNSIHHGLLSDTGIHPNSIWRLRKSHKHTWRLEGKIDRLPVRGDRVVASPDNSIVAFFVHVTPLERGSSPAIPSFTIPKPFPKDVMDVACSDNGKYWALEGRYPPGDMFSLEALTWPGLMLAVWDCEHRAFTRADMGGAVDDSPRPIWLAPAGPGD
jgi:hypothetical protein